MAGLGGLLPMLAEVGGVSLELLSMLIEVKRVNCTQFPKPLFPYGSWATLAWICFVGLGARFHLSLHLAGMVSVMRHRRSM